MGGVEWVLGKVTFLTERINLSVSQNQDEEANLETVLSSISLKP